MNAPPKNRPQYTLGGPTALFRCSSYCKHAPPTVNIAPPTVHSAPPTVHSAPPTVNTAPPTVNWALLCKRLHLEEPFFPLIRYILVFFFHQTTHPSLSVQLFCRTRVIFFIFLAHEVHSSSVLLLLL